MKKLIAITALILIISGTSYAFRASKPPVFTKLDDPVQLTNLNNTLEDLWNITNGRISIDIRASDGNVDNGDIWIIDSGSTHQLRWRAGDVTYSVTGTP